MSRREPEPWVAFADALAAYERRERSGQLPSRKVLLVSPHDDGGWRVELQGGEGISSRFNSEPEAIRATRTFAAAYPPADVQIYDSAKKLRAQFSYEIAAPEVKEDGPRSA